MKENDSGKENNYTLICVWQLGFIPLAHRAKIKADIVGRVVSAFGGVVALGSSETAPLGQAFSGCRGATFCTPLPCQLGGGQERCILGCLL